MSAFYRYLERFLAAAEAVATATVVAARGSTPREVGARMIVRRDGAILGSVGGGCGEAQVFWEAARVLEDGRPRLVEVDLTGEIDDLSPTHCGGVMEVFVDRLDWSGAPALGLSDRDVLAAIAGAGAARGSLAVVVAVDNPKGAGDIPVGTKWVVGSGGSLLGAAPADLVSVLREAASAALASGRSGRAWASEAPPGWALAGEHEGLGVFVEVVVPPPEVLVVGAGHIALSLAPMVKLLDFRVTVVDDRGAFASRERFPEADEVLVGRIEDVLQRRPIGPWSYVVLITRGHQYDEAALRVVLGSGAAYIGMIGSRRRVKEVFRHLAAAGFPAEAIARVHAPVGLDIGAETPAEIAVAIAAQLVQVRRASAPG